MMARGLALLAEPPPGTAPEPAPAPATIVGGGNRPLVLDDPGEAWIVEEGYVDVFAAIPASGPVPGGRQHLFRAEAGMCLFGVGEPAAARLLAVGSLGSRLRRAQATGDAAAADDPLALEVWVGRMTRAALAGEGDWPHRVLEPGPQRLEAAGHAAADPRRLLWVTPVAGEVAWLGSAPLDPGLALPLAAPAWIAATGAAEADLAVSAAPPAADRIGPALAGFNRLVLDRVVARRARDQEAERRRLADSSASAAEGVSEALRALAGVAAGRRGAPARRPAVGDPLAQALERVCAASGHAAELPRPRPEDGSAADIGAQRLARLLEAARLRTRPIVLADGWWRSDGLPVLGWLGEERRPVALLPTGRGRWRLAAGGGPDHTPVDAPVDAALAGAVARDAIQVYPSLPAEPVSLRALAAFGRTGGIGADLRTMAAMGLLGALAALLLPVSAGLLFDAVVPLGDRAGLAQIVAGLVAAVLGRASFDMVRALAVLRLEARLDARLQAALVDRLLRLPARFFRGYSVGDLMERTLGLQEARELITGSAVSGLFGGIFGLASLGLLAAYDWRLALVALALVAGIAATTAGISWGQLRHERGRVRAKGRVDGFVLQLIVGIGKLRTAAAEPRALAEWAWRSGEQRRAFVAARRFVAFQEVAQASLPTLSLLAIYAAVAHYAEADTARQAIEALVPTYRGEGDLGPFSTGSFIAFSAAFGQLTAALTATATALTQMLAAVPLLERTRPILEAVPEIATQAEAPGPLQGRVELRRVSFRYASDAPLSLRDVSLAIEPGAFVALVGASGSGKSTIMRLLLGFERPEAGDVFYDGRSVERIDRAALRRDIGVVLQNGRVTAGTIFDNIVGTSRLTLEDAWAAARLVNLDGDVEAMPMGMHTVLADGGGALSGGQRQRILLARSLVRRPRILLLDEATSALDNPTQAVVTATLAKLSITRVVIAHRLSTVRDVDRIVVLEGGRLVQSGSYDELAAARDGAFAALVRRQLL